MKAGQRLWRKPPSEALSCITSMCESFSPMLSPCMAYTNPLLPEYRQSIWRRRRTQKLKGSQSGWSLLFAARSPRLHMQLERPHLPIEPAQHLNLLGKGMFRQIVYEQVSYNRIVIPLAAVLYYTLCFSISSVKNKADESRQLAARGYGEVLPRGCGNPPFSPPI